MTVTVTVTVVTGPAVLEMLLMLEVTNCVTMCPCDCATVRTSRWRPRTSPRARPWLPPPGTCALLARSGATRAWTTSAGTSSRSGSRAFRTPRPSPSRCGLKP
eukprot:4607919-Pyramimonas_sp.AAC.1